MIAFPNCKINLGLHITSRREDGYHNIETVFYPVLQQKDILECIKAPVSDPPGIVFTSSGLPIAGNTDSNLCVKAYRLLKKDFPSLAPVQMHLHKIIPMGAGLGGGSADAAAALVLLNDMFTLGLSQQQLMHYALQLGSDCPFFILNKPCFATGRGEEMEEIQLDLSAYTIHLFNPRIHISTAAAFSGITPAKPVQSLKDIVQLPVTEWKGLLVNDFEKTVFKAYPELEEIKASMYETGALYVSMTGSGSTMYSIYKKNARHQPGDWYGGNPFVDNNR